MIILENIKKILDPRDLGKVQHSLSTIIFSALCGVLAGCENWNEIRDYCKIKKDWLSRYVSFKNGVPSSDTFRRVFSLLDPDNIENLLRTHASEIVDNNKNDNGQIAVDGKSLRGSKRLNSKCLHSVSAWCHENGLIIGEEQVDSKSNEITAIPLLLDSLNIKNNTITIDAAGCQKNIVSQIISKKGNYVLGLKRNHPRLYDAVKQLVKATGESDKNRLKDGFDDSHGRCVRRRYFGYDVSKLPEIEEWFGAKTVVAVETISSKDNDPKRTRTAEWRYFLSNHHHLDNRLPGYIRNHWSIENKLHWVLDVHMKEDADQKSERNSARSFSLIKRIVLNIVKTKDTTPKRSLKRKLKHPAWDNDHLLKMLS